MHKLILHIGSNLGNRIAYLQFAKDRIQEHIGVITLCSSIYETEAWGGIEQNSFLNQALEVETAYSAEMVLIKCQAIEYEAQRSRSLRWGPRTLDIDLILFDQEIIDNETLTIPHPRMLDRNFVMFPVSEIVPHWIHPEKNESMAVLKSKSQDKGTISIYQDE